MLKAGVVGVAFQAVGCAGKILDMPRVASCGATRTTVGGRPVAGSAGCRRRVAAPGRRYVLEVAVDVAAAAKRRGCALVEGAGAVFIDGGKRRIVDAGRELDLSIAVSGYVCRTAWVAGVACGRSRRRLHMGAMVALKTAGSRITAGFIQGAVIDRCRCPVTAIALHGGIG